MADETRNKMNKQSEKDLVSEMNEALANMATSVEDILYVVPDDITVIGAHKIANGGVTYMFNSDDAATWLRTPGALENIRRAAGDETAASLQLNNVIVPFAPTAIDIGDNATWRGIENSSGLTTGTIRNIRFLKPAKHHHEGQREAHLVLGLDSREQANKIIQAGVIIEGKELQARKELPDATRWMKCSVLPCDHDAKDCPNTTKCGRCAGGHVTRDCKVTDRKKFHCVNCKVNGHGAVDRNTCPSFIRATDIVHSRHPESKYRYFVTEDPATWATYDVQTQAETARPSKVIGKSTGRPNTQSGTTTSSLGSFLVSPHMTRDKCDGGSMKQNKGKRTNSNMTPMGPNKYHQPSINQYLARSQQPPSMAPSDGETGAEEDQILDAENKNRMNVEPPAPSLPIDL